MHIVYIVGKWQFPSWGRSSSRSIKKLDRGFFVHRFAVGLKWIHANPAVRNPIVDGADCAMLAVLCTMYVCTVRSIYLQGY